jgi:hypothetical protein
MNSVQPAMRRHGRALLAVIAGAAFAAGVAAAARADTQEPDATPLVSGTVNEDTVTTRATVTHVDLEHRMVTLRRHDGSIVELQVGPEVRNLPQVAVGDEVTAVYYESLAYDVRPAGTATPPPDTEEHFARAEPGGKPGAVGSRMSTLTATITGVDPAAGTVTLRGPTGRSLTVKARDPRKLAHVSVGDLVDITYTEAVAISVDAPAH